MDDNMDNWKPVDDKYLMLTNPREYRKARMKNLKLDSVLHKQLIAWRSEEQLALSQLRFATRDAAQSGEALKQQLLFSRATSLACLEAAASRPAGGHDDSGLRAQLTHLRHGADTYVLDFAKSVRRPRKSSQQLRQEAAQRAAEKLEAQARAQAGAKRPAAGADAAGQRRSSRASQEEERA